MRRAGVVLCLMTALEAAPRLPWGQLVQRAEEAPELPRASLVLKVRLGAIAEDEVGSSNGTKCEATCGRGCSGG